MTTESTSAFVSGAPSSTDPSHIKQVRNLVRTMQMWSTDFHRTPGEEWANFGTHLAGLVFGIFALTYMCVEAGRLGDARKIVGGALYGMSLIVLYNSSMLYHLANAWRVKGAFQIMDHISIYLLIAGSYTPFCLVTLRDTQVGFWILCTNWALAVGGILTELLVRPRKEWLAVTITLLMGWEIIFCIKPLYDRIGTLAWVMLLIGGGSYTVGVIFYVMDRVPYMHTVWHVFVLAASVCHWVGIMFGVMLYGV
ncbi:MAG: hemolysin III family protein [Victivallales bacterium]|nr:hemolysin III family protein [Victivallales bacterium]